jgi:hypothetical protein
MKKDARDRRRIPPEESLERYDWSRATRGRYASRFPRNAHAVVINPQLWPHFGTAEAVNEGLRALVKMAELAAKVSRKRRVVQPKSRRAA